MKTRNLVLAVAAFALAACNNENEAVMTPVALTVNANITDVSNTRVGTTSFDAADVIGVSVKNNNSGLTEGTNVKYTAEAVSSTDSNNGKIVFKSTSPIYFADGKTVTFSAYYPYNADVTDKATAISLNTTGQTESTQSDYDFLYAEADGSVADKDGISMTFKHKMAKLTFTFVAGSGVKSDDNFFTNLTKAGTYKVEGLKHNGKFDTADGTTTIASDAKAEDITPTVPAQNTEVTGSKETKSSSIIIYPQSPEAKTVKVTLTYNDVAYIATLGLPTDGFTAGNNYAYTVTLNQTGLTISEASITDWVTKDQTGVNAEYEYPYDIKDQGKDDSSTAGLAYDGEEDLEFQ
jgi:hypothetical protein